MRARGIEVLLNQRVSAMTAGKVYLQDGSTIDTHTVISTVGNAPHPLIEKLCTDNKIETQGGRIVTDDTLRVKGQECLWAAGDCAAIPMRNPRHQDQRP